MHNCYMLVSAVFRWQDAQVGDLGSNVLSIKWNNNHSIIARMNASEDL